MKKEPCLFLVLYSSWPALYHTCKFSAGHVLGNTSNHDKLRSKLYLLKEEKEKKHTKKQKFYIVATIFKDQWQVAKMLRLILEIGKLVITFCQIISRS